MRQLTPSQQSFLYALLEPDPGNGDALWILDDFTPDWFDFTDLQIFTRLGVCTYELGGTFPYNPDARVWLTIRLVDHDKVISLLSPAPDMVPTERDTGVRPAKETQPERLAKWAEDSAPGNWKPGDILKAGVSDIVRTTTPNNLREQFRLAQKHTNKVQIDPRSDGGVTITPLDL